MVIARAVASRTVLIPLPVPIVSRISSPVPNRVQATREARTKRKNGQRRQNGFHRRPSPGYEQSGGGGSSGNCARSPARADCPSEGEGPRNVGDQGILSLFAQKGLHARLPADRGRFRLGSGSRPHRAFSSKCLASTRASPSCFSIVSRLVPVSRQMKSGFAPAARSVEGGLKVPEREPSATSASSPRAATQLPALAEATSSRAS
jgi:hypothetical protein